MGSTSDQDRKYDQKTTTTTLISAQEGNATTFRMGLHVQHSGTILESDVNKVTSKYITKFAKVGSEKGCD